MIELFYDRNLTMEEAMKTDTEDKKCAELEKEVFILRAIYDSAIDQGILACDREGRIIVYNLPSSVYDGMAINQFSVRNLQMYSKKRIWGLFRKYSRRENLF